MYSPSIEDSHHFFGIIDKIYLSNIHNNSFALRNLNNLEIEELINSILQHGLLNPIIVREISGGDSYEIVSGLRRYLACKALGWKKIQCHIVNITDVQTFEIALIENINRKSLSPLEEGNAFKIYTVKNGWGSISELSRKIGRSPSYITKRMALLDLPEDIRSKIETSNLKPSLAEELLSIKDSGKQSSLGNIITENSLTIDKVRKMVKLDPEYCYNSENTSIRRELQSFSKAIIALRITLNRLAEIREEEENFLIKESISQNTRAIHSQIDNLLKQKKKYAKGVFQYRRLLNS
ncbi:MAG: ParB/RepB/Spo0J family partition protein [Candidatus Nitrosocosmicus sp.]